MLTDTERRMLQEQGLGECWHEINDYCCSCGDCFNEFAYVDCLGRTVTTHLESNRTFTDAQDYEDLLEKVVRPNTFSFTEYTWNIWAETRIKEKINLGSFGWFLTLSIEERCKLIHDFGVEVLGWTKAIIEQEGK